MVAAQRMGECGNAMPGGLLQRKNIRRACSQEQRHDLGPRGLVGVPTVHVERRHAHAGKCCASLLHVMNCGWMREVLEKGREGDLVTAFGTWSRPPPSHRNRALFVRALPTTVR